MNIDTGVKFEFLTSNEERDIEPRWGQRIYTEEKFTKARLESIIGSPLSKFIQEAPPIFKYGLTLLVDVLATYGGAALILAAVEQQISTLKSYLDKINRGQCNYIVFRTYWVPGPIYGYYVQDTTTMTYM